MVYSSFLYIIILSLFSANDGIVRRVCPRKRGNARVNLFTL